MKKLITLSAMLFLLVGGLFAQKLSYQAVVRNTSNKLVVNTALTVEVSVKDAANAVQYAETHNVTSNQNGLILLTIGDGTVTQGTDLSAVNWEGATIESVIKNGGATVATISSPVNAVPYALQAANAAAGMDQVQANWEETDVNAKSFIQNKPTIPTMPDMSGYVTSEQLQNAGYVSENQLATALNGYVTNQDAANFLTQEADPTVHDWAKEPNKPAYSYDEITGTPEIPTVNDVTITLTQGNSQLGSFSTNAAQEVTIDIPTQMIPEQVQANWEETDVNAKSFIQNKPTIPTMPDMSGYVTSEQLQNAGFLRYETQTLSDVAAYGTHAGDRQLKGLADPTDAQDAVTLSYLTAQLSALQQQLDQLSATVAAQQAVIDSLTNGGGSGNDPVTPTTFTCGDNLIDGNNSYTTHQFGSQCWMTQNLRNASETGNPSYPDLLTACPTGWHLPDENDWNTLGSSLPSSSVDFGDGIYWTTTNSNQPWEDGDGNQFTIWYNWASVRTNNVTANAANGIACEVNDALNCDCNPNNEYCISVRCVRDETGGGSTTQTPTVTTGSATAVTESGATLNATITNPDNATITFMGFEYKVSGSNTSYTTVEGTSNGNNFTATLTDLTEGTEYTYHAVIAYDNDNNTVTGSELTFTTTSATPSTFTCGTDKMTDANGNEYETVLIGTQCWTKTNMRVAPNGATDGTPSNAMDNTTPYYYINTDVDDSIYGYYYNWEAAKLACPSGWHLPSDAEWTTMEATQTESDVTVPNGRGGHAGKLSGSGWNTSSTSGAPGDSTDPNHNNSGFSAVPAGRWNEGFGLAGEITLFWSSTESYTDNAWMRGLYSYLVDVNRNNSPHNRGYSVRCVRDNQ